MEKNKRFGCVRYAELLNFRHFLHIITKLNDTFQSNLFKMKDEQRWKME